MLELEANILVIVNEVLAEAQLDLVDFSFKNLGNVYRLEVLADKSTGGINMDECASVNKKLIERIDASALLYDNYTLNVFSPGIDWPLKNKRDFLRVLHRPVRIHLSEKVYEKLEHHGVVQGTDEENVIILNQEQELRIPFNRITKAVQII